MTLFTQNNPYHHILKYLLFLLKHSVYWFTEQMIRSEISKQKLTAANKAQILEVLMCVWNETSHQLDICYDTTRFNVVIEKNFELTFQSFLFLTL